MDASGFTLPKRLIFYFKNWEELRHPQKRNMYDVKTSNQYTVSAELCREEVSECAQSVLDYDGDARMIVRVNLPREIVRCDTPYSVSSAIFSMIY